MTWLDHLTTKMPEFEKAALHYIKSSDYQYVTKSNLNNISW